METNFILEQFFSDVFVIMKNKAIVSKNQFVKHNIKLVEEDGYDINVVIRSIVKYADNNERKQIQSHISVARGKQKLLRMMGFLNEI